MQLQIYSPELQFQVEQALEPVVLELSGNTTGALHGFVLLKHRQRLTDHLRHLQNLPRGSVSGNIVAEMRLLVHGFLDDPEVFLDYGYEDLFDEGYLTFNQWTVFQDSEFNQQIDALEYLYFDDDDDDDVSICGLIGKSQRILTRLQSTSLTSSQSTTATTMNHPPPGFPLS